MSFDIVTFGETMLRLTPPHDLRFEQATDFKTFVAGSESNTAVGLSRLGARVCWFSRLPDSSLGRLVANQIRQHEVDVSSIIWSQDDRLGLYFVEDGAPPRPTQVIYDRANSAMSKIQPEDMPRDLFQQGKATCLHVTGITLALSESASDTVMHAIQDAKEAQWLVSFDLNYRSKLWSPERAKEVYMACMQLADVIFIPLRDARLLFGYADDLNAEAVLSDLHALYPHAVIALTNGSAGSYAVAPDGSIVHEDAFQADGAYRIGAGDAFSAGFLYRYVCHSRDDLALALRWGNAVASLKFSIQGDMPIVDKAHVEALVNRSQGTQLVR